MPNTCETCRHFSKIPATRSIYSDCVGECRRRAPMSGVSTWPRVKAVDYCSEFESRAVDFATVAADLPPGSIVPVPAARAPLHALTPADVRAVRASTTPAAAPAAGELPLSLGTGAEAPTPPDAAKTPAADAPGSTRPRGAKSPTRAGAKTPPGTDPAGAE